jgi:hypothetical protein
MSGNENNNVQVNEHMMNVTSAGLIFPYKILPPCFTNDNLSDSLEKLYEQYSGESNLLTDS